MKYNEADAMFSIEQIAILNLPWGGDVVTCATPRARSGANRAQRRERRSPLAVPVTVCGFGTNGRLFFELTRIYDISGAGCRIHLHTQPQLHSPLAVRFVRYGTGADDSLQRLFQMAWLRPDADGWTVGAETVMEHWC